MKKITLLLVSSLLITTVFGQEAWTLQKCIDHAFQHNIQIKQSELNLATAGINKEANVGTMLPSLNASATHGYNWGQTIDQFTNQFATSRIQSNNIGISTGMTLFNGFQNLNRVRQSNVDVEVNQANLEKMQNDIALNVANAFLNVLFQEELLKIAVSNADNTAEQVKRIQDLVDAGAAARSSLLDIQAQYATDQASLVQSENNLMLAYLSLRQLLLIPSSEAANFKISAPNLEEFSDIKLPSSPESAIAHAQSSFPEVKSAKATLERSQMGISIAKGAMSPRLGVSYSYGSGYSGAYRIPVGEPIIGSATPIGYVEGTGDLVVTPTFSYADYQVKGFGDQIRDNKNSSLFFSLTMPLFNGFSTKTNIARAEITQRNAEYNLELTQQQLRQSIESAYADAIAADKSYRAAETSAEAAELSLDFAKIRFEEGASNAVDYTAARVRLDNAKANFIRSKYDYIFKVKVVEFYMGQPITFR